MSNGPGRKKILLVCPTPPPFIGPTIATEILLNSHFAAAFRIVHVDTADRRSLENLGKVDLTNVCLALRHYGQIFFHLFRARADLLYTPIAQTSLGFLRDSGFVLLSKTFRKKTVLHFRGGNFQDFYGSAHPIVKWIVRKVLGSVDGMIVLGNSLKEQFHGLVKEERLSVVPNGLDLSLGWEKRTIYENGLVRILFLSNIRKAKGVWEVLRSVPRVTRSHPNVRFILAGDWVYAGEKKACQEFMRQQGIEAHVEFPGPAIGREKLRLLREADLFVLPSHREGHPWVVVEAMAAGLPVVASDVGCLRETVLDGENGYVIPPRDAEALVEKILHLINDPEERHRMGQRSREIYEERFTEERFAEGMIDVVRRTLERS